MRRVLVVLALTLSSSMAGAQSAAPAPTPRPEPAAGASSVLPAQPWELRRARFLATVESVRAGDAEARAEYGRLVREFEQQPFSLTPLEAMDYIGSTFVPQAGVEKMLPLLAAQALLGLYDMYRFGSNLAEAVLIDAERFLPRALVLAGPEQAATSRTFMRDNPERTAALVREGIALLEDGRAAPGYEKKWVRALARCPAEDTYSCPPLRDVPLAQWPELWKKARQRVIDYYRVEPNAAAKAVAPDADR